MHVVVGYVPSAEGVAAFEYATASAKRAGATLVVVNTGSRGDDSGGLYADSAHLDALGAQLDAAGVAHEIRQPANAGSAAEEILRAAGDLNAESIVIGVRRRSPVGKLFLGSTSQRVLLEADCPVVAVKAPPAK